MPNACYHNGDCSERLGDCQIFISDVQKEQLRASVISTSRRFSVMFVIVFLSKLSDSHEA